MSGSDYERELVTAFAEMDYPAMRAPSSGACTQRELPDVLVGFGKRTTPWAIELKSTKQNAAYYTNEEVERLVYFATMFGAKPRLGARFKRPGKDRKYYFKHPADARQTEQSYVVDAEDADVDATVLNVTRETFDTGNVERTIEELIE